MSMSAQYRSSRSSLVLLLCATAAMLGAASDQRAADHHVELTLAVTDPDDNAVRDLTTSQVQVFESGLERAVLSVRSLADQPLAIMFLLDTSNSMDADPALGARVAVECAGRLRAHDRAAVVGFDSKIYTIQEFTGDATLISRSMSNIRRQGSTALNNALLVGVREVQKFSTAQASAPRPVLVVVSDGVDTSSLVGFDRVMDAVRRSSMIIYGAGRNGTPQRPGQSVLPRLAKETGGQHLLPGRTQDAARLCDRILADLRSQSAVRYAPAGPGTDGKWREVEVRVTVPRTRVRTRSGYFPSTPNTPGHPS